ncbi:MAG TPA: ABC transporter permease [Terracidiphilus sp.]|nr:ABC transporter permease [Terracidiphilus sp.]
MLSDFRYRVRAIFRRRRLNDELDEELRDHIDHETEKYVRSGMPAEEARRKALLTLGGLDQVRQRTRESRGTGAVEHLRQDLRYGLRSLAKNRGFTAVFILTLALGIGSCTAIFSLMTAVIFPPLPYGNAGRLVYIYTPNPGFGQIPLDAIPPDNADFADLKRENHSLSTMTGFQQERFRLNGNGVSLGAAAVDADFFSTLQSSPVLGRAINADDNQPGHSGVAVISHSLWQQVFGSDPAVLGKPIQLGDKTYRVIGVMPAGFHYPHRTDLDDPDSHIAETDVWVPLALTPKQRADRALTDDYGYALGRLKDGVSVSQATTDLSAIMHQLDPLHEGIAFRQGWYAYLKPFMQTLEGSARPLLLLLMGAVLFVLLIACGNAANLLLARSAGRAHELGVRATLGAGRARLVRQMLTESLLLGLGGGLAGIVLSRIFLRLLLILDPGNIPRLQQASLDGRVLAFAIAVTFLTSILAGVLPAVSASQVNLVEFLKSGGQKGVARGRNRMRASLIVAQVATVVVLLAGAGLLVRSYINLMRVPVGFNASTLSMQLNLPESYAKPEQRQAFYQRLLSQLGSTPGTLAAGAVVNLPFGDSKGMTTFWVEGYSNQPGQLVDGAFVTPDYFSAMGMPILRGRPFTQDDVSPAPKVVIVNQAFAQKYFAGRDPIGKWVSGDQPLASNKPIVSGSFVIGVVANERDWSVESPPQPQLFTPLRDPSDAYVVIRSALPRKNAASSATAVLHRIDPGLTFSKIRTMHELVSEATARQRFQTVLLCIFAVMAMALALIGFYGLLAYSVNQRGAEMGVRIALGATRAHVIRLVLRQGLSLVSAGLALGLAAALGLTRLLASSLFGVSVLDPLTFIAVPALFLVATLAACLIPARRAARSDPIAVLRCE